MYIKLVHWKSHRKQTVEEPWCSLDKAERRNGQVIVRP